MGTKTRGNYPIKISICQNCGKVIRDNYIKFCKECDEEAHIRNLKRGIKR